MKKFTLLVLVFILISGNIYPQDWIHDLPQDKLNNGTLTFYEIQDAFYSYWEPLEVEKGFYMDEGAKSKIPYYKIFKRWEWYWETRIDPKTGAFPDAAQLEAAYQSLQNNSESSGGNWVSLGPTTSPGGYAGLGRMNCVAFVPGSTTEYYAGAASGGIWHTVDDGANWTILNDTVPVLGVSDIIVVKPVVGPHTLYIATGDRDGGSLWSLGGQQNNDNNSVGILKSTDGGATWTTTSLSFTLGQTARVNRLLLDPNSGYQTMYAATTQGVYKTTDGWATKSLLTTTAFIDMEFKPGDPTTIYASTEGWSTTAIYRSTNSGSSFSQIASYSGRRTELAVSYNQPNWVYAVVANANNGLDGVYQSTNSGASYNKVYDGALTNQNLLGWNCDGSGTSGQGWYDLCIAADPNNANTVYVGGINTWKSTNGGTSFSIVNHWTGCSTPFAQAVHADKHFFAFQNASSTLFECNDGGLYKTSDGGTNWSHLSSGMATSQIYRMGVGQTQADEVIIGLQDNGTKALLSGTWNDVIGGDGFECIVDYTDENTQYGALYYGDIYKTTDYWWNSSQITNSIPQSGAWCTPYLMDPTSNNTLYVGYEDVWKSTNGGSTWSQISNQGSTSSYDFQNMAISASNPLYIYAATHDNIFRTTSGGGSTQVWGSVASNLPLSTSNITYVSVKDDDPNHVWVSMGGYNSDGVYETTDGGGSWNDISTGLPSVPIMCVIQNTDYTGIELYAGTDAGVYVMRDGGSWTPFSDGLPNVVVTELEIYYGATPNDHKLYAATYGRGVWWSDLYTTTGPTADFSGTPTSGLPPLGVTFTDLSTPGSGSLTSWLWDFGDGNTSTTQNPMHTYINPGLYTVALTVTSSTGGSNTETKTDYIDVQYAVPTADFTADITSGIAPLTVNFTDISLDSVNTWHWDFGNGDTSILQNPQYNYNDPGMYTVSLTVTGPGGSDTETKTDYIDVHYAPPTAGFSADPTTGNPPLNVQFTDLSADSVNTWSWDFGDGGNSLEQNPLHIYSNTGTYTVSLTVSGPGGSDSETKADYITVSTLPPPVADFTADPTSGFFPLMVNFTDQSTGDVTAWKWYFGDGNTSTMQNPAHTYLDAGGYTVSLKSIGPGGSDSIAKENYITVMVGIKEVDEDNLKVYPNPCNDFIVMSAESGIKSITIADIIGNIVKDESLNCVSPCERKISMTDLHSGIYFCRITLDDNSLVLMKILKE